MATSAQATAVFPGARARTGMYESFYLRAVSPSEPVGLWIRHTVQKPPGERARGSVWCTAFDAARGLPYQHKLTSERLTTPAGEWIEVGRPEGGEGGRMGPTGADGGCGGASWSLRFEDLAPELRHLPREWLYRAPLPRTKLTSPAPSASFHGSLRLPDRPEIELAGWQGMIGHNWGAEHAERWIWLHGVGFEEAPEAWLDVALGRLKLAGRLTPWVANGVISLDGRRLRLGGLGARGLDVRENAGGCTLSLPAEGGAVLRVRATVPGETAAGWRYSDPDGTSEHDVANCSIAGLELELQRPGGEPRRLRSPHGGVYELGMRERDHGVPIAPFGD
ncbi:MAG TPA: hypothetical protein VL988_02570 [Solirubrobacteraceae bacterium]|nr:hypothetical protein [Solirubrobacteraceae bacterium]